MSKGEIKEQSTSITQFFNETVKKKKKPPLFEEEVFFIENEKTYYGHLVIVDYVVSFISKDWIYDSIPYNKKFFTFPLFSIKRINPLNENKFFFDILLKDRRRLSFKSKNYFCHEKLSVKAFPFNIMNIYQCSFSFHEHMHSIYPINGWSLYNIQTECTRMGVNADYRITTLNNNFELCPTYPPLLIVPSNFPDKKLIECASYRSKNRFPVLTYFFKFNKCCLFRSAQCLSGINSKTSEVEREYFREIIKRNKRIIIYDARSYVNAIANSFKGAGIEKGENYDNCEVVYCDIENIFAVKAALKKVKEIAKVNDNNRKYYSMLEGSKWLEYISMIIKSATEIVESLMRNESVLVHCSDGWDRTTQMSALAQIIIDPYYRTLIGFCVLIEKDWVSFGHQFEIRSGITFIKEEKKKHAPIFIQFLDCVYQVMVQFPTVFEFNYNMLLFLANEVYSYKFGTFLCNCERDKEKYKIKENTISIWSEVLKNKKDYVNPLYMQKEGRLKPEYKMQYLVIWTDYFFQFNKDKPEYNDVDDSVYKETMAIYEMIKIIKENNLYDNLSIETQEYIKSKV